MLTTLIILTKVIQKWTNQKAVRATAPAALLANTRNRPSAYLGRNRVPRGGVENLWLLNGFSIIKILRICIDEIK